MGKNNKRQKTKLIEAELKKEAEIFTESIEFWGKQISSVLEEIENLEKEADIDPEYEEKMSVFIDKLTKLIQKGNIEKEQLDKLEKKVFSLKSKTDKEKGRIIEKVFDIKVRA